MLGPRVAKLLVCPGPCDQVRTEQSEPSPSFHQQTAAARSAVCLFYGVILQICRLF